jgi:putative ABC transport system permease protein
MLLTAVELKDAVMMALSSLRANKLRSGLTILGVLIGVSSVIGLAAIIDGLNGAMDREIDSLGSNIIDIDRYPIGTDYDELTEEERAYPFLTVGEARAIQEHCPSVDGVAPMNHYWAPGGNVAKYKKRKATRHALLGTWPDFMEVKDKEVVAGRFIGELDVNQRAMVCVLGDGIKETLFPDENAIDREIRINGNRFLVIGVLEKIASNFNETYENNKIMIPLSTFEKLHPWDEALTLAARAVSYEQMETAKEEIIDVLRVYRKVAFNKENNFALITQDTFKDEIANITQYIYLAMLIITSVGLMVGGIGVMNIMLVSVTERTREIGVRKAIGAKSANVLLQFLTEAMTLSGVGGVIGIIVGALLGIGANSAFGFPVSIPLFWVVVGFMVAVTVGLVSGMYPAWKASRLDPIEALRYE